MKVLADQSLLFFLVIEGHLQHYVNIWYLDLDLYIVNALLLFNKYVYNVYFETSGKISFYSCHYLYTLIVVTLVK